MLFARSHTAPIQRIAKVRCYRGPCSRQGCLSSRRFSSCLLPPAAAGDSVPFMRLLSVGGLLSSRHGSFADLGTGACRLSPWPVSCVAPNHRNNFLRRGQTVDEKLGQPEWTRPTMSLGGCTRCLYNLPMLSSRTNSSSRKEPVLSRVADIGRRCYMTRCSSCRESKAFRCSCKAEIPAWLQLHCVTTQQYQICPARNGPTT